MTLNVGDQKGTGAEAVLAAAGLLKTLPFKVNWSDFTSGPPMLQAMASGSVDVGGVGDAPPVFAASGGEAIEIVGARQTNGDQDALVVPKGSPITSIQQLKGKKIAYASGSSANYNLLTVLNKASLTTKDVTLVNLQPADALAAFTSGSVEAWDVWPPYVQQVVAQNGRPHHRHRVRLRQPVLVRGGVQGGRGRPEEGRRDQGLPDHPEQGATSGPPPIRTSGRAAWAEAIRAAGQRHGAGGQDRRHHTGRRSRTTRSRPSRAWSTSSSRPGSSPPRST